MQYFHSNSTGRFYEGERADLALPSDAQEMCPIRAAHFCDAQKRRDALIARGLPVGGWAITQQAIDAAIAGLQPSQADIVERNTFKRNQLLSQSDWTQAPDVMADAPETKAAWATYRQALRDMSLSVPDWPDAPVTA